MSTAAVILAAGASSRMGTPKQAVRFGGVSLLKRAAAAALGAGCDPVIVVIGANPEFSRAELSGLAIQEAFNAEWSTGMASSLRTGVQHLTATSADATALIVMLCDQPHVTSDVLTSLLA